MSVLSLWVVCIVRERERTRVRQPLETRRQQGSISGRESGAAVVHLLERPHCSFAYSALASFRMRMSGSASFQSVRKSL